MGNCRETEIGVCKEKRNQIWIFGEFLPTGFDTFRLTSCACEQSSKTGFFSWNSGKILLFLLIVMLSSPGLVTCDLCLFSDLWTGSWFQKGIPDPIRIYNGTISNKGTCRDNDGDKFLIENTLEQCYRCVVLHKKHPNVLQYKETHCSTKDEHKKLDTLCSEINGDALLYSMFRLHTPAVSCPFKGSYTFSYRRDHGDCAYPISTVDSCTMDSHLLLRFQACADVIGSESRVEELVCLAVWKEGSTKYLVGKLEHKVAKADEDKFRCFVYEVSENGSVVQIAQSGDATCDGLFAANEGSRTMVLKKANHPHARCHFPEWFTGTRHWRVLDGLLAYVSHKNGSFRVTNTTTGDTVKRVVCTQESSMVPSSSSTLTTTAASSTNLIAQYVVHVTYGCNSGYSCLRLHKRAPHVVEIQISKILVTQASEACLEHNYDFNPSDIVTVTTETAGSLDCPLAGIYSMHGNHLHLSRLISLDVEKITLCAGTTTLTTGCSAKDQMELQHDCTTQKKGKTFQCRGSWEENGTNYVIATAVGTSRHLCLAYTENENIVRFSGSMEACLRSVHPGREGIIAFNGTSKGQCPSSAPPTRRSSQLLEVLSTALIILIFRIR